MAFDLKGLDPTGAMRKGSPGIGTYVNTSDALATIEASGYFAASALVYSMLKDGQLLLVKGSDGTRLYKVTISGTTVTLSHYSSEGGVTTPAASTTALTNSGVKALASSLVGAHTLAAPYPGAEVTITNLGGTAQVVTPASGTTVSATGGAITFGVVDGVIVLVGVSTTRWAVKYKNSSLVTVA